MTAKKAAPRPAAAAPGLKAQVEELQAQVAEAAWYIGELQYVLKSLVTRMLVEQVRPAAQAQMEAQLNQQVADALEKSGLAGLVSK